MCTEPQLRRYTRCAQRTPLTPSPSVRRAHENPVDRLLRRCARRALRKLLPLLLGFAGATPGWAVEGPRLGRLLTLDEIAAISIHVFPDGSGLPPGRGSVAQGATIYRQRCAACHGPEGQGVSADELAGATNSLTDDPPDKTIGTYWPYATTLFDYVRRSMPLDAPRSLSADEVYAVTAYLLFLNGILDEDKVLDAASLSKVRMPNRDGFIPVYQPGER